MVCVLERPAIPQDCHSRKCKLFESKRFKWRRCGETDTHRWQISIWIQKDQRNASIHKLMKTPNVHPMEPFSLRDCCACIAHSRMENIEINFTQSECIDVEWRTTNVESSIGRDREEARLLCGTILPNAMRDAMHATVEMLSSYYLTLACRHRRHITCPKIIIEN